MLLNIIAFIDPSLAYKPVGSWMVKVSKAVITAGGLGTRLLPAAKEIPKEMLPVYARSSNGDIVLKPVIQVLFEILYNLGIRSFCIVTGRGKRALEDHFTPDYSFLNVLRERGKESIARDLEEFYGMVESSTIIWVRQPKPLGFGHAVYMARFFVGDDPFVLVAADTIVYPKGYLEDLLGKYSSGADGVLLLRYVPDPKAYGVAVVDNGLVVRVVEKPREPPSNLAIMPYYILPPDIMGVLAGLKPGVGGEIQLTDAIEELVEKGFKFKAVVMESGDFADVGTPEGYLRALEVSYRYAVERG
jgi:UTP--glucose-1-phosphate uridylyltransferase